MSNPAPIEMLSLLYVLTMQQVILKHLRFVDYLLVEVHAEEVAHPVHVC
jgi:hypothetical protein